MVYFKWITGVMIALLIGLFLHYTLPGRDIVQIAGTDIKRMDISGTSLFWATPPKTSRSLETRDVRFINAIDAKGGTKVYRNEDTAWSWPPYFKFDSSDITAQAQAFSKKDGVWVSVSHYGWRIEFLSIFPNVLKIREVAGPDVTLIPWFNITFFVFVAILLVLIWRAAHAFKTRRIDPMVDQIDTMMEDVGDRADDARDQVIEAKRGVVAWFRRTLTGKP